MQAAPQSAARDRYRKALALLLLSAAALWCVYWFVHAWGYWEDDAWIHLEFARSLAQGRGFAFNGHVVAGDTAPLWVFLLAAMHAVVPPWLLAGKLLAAMGAVFGLAGVYALALRAGRELASQIDAEVFAAAMVLLVVVNPYTCYWIFSGMEVVAAAGLACFAVLLATRARPTTASFLGGCLLAGLGPLLRPEMFFLAALLALPLFGQWRRLDAAPAAKAVYLVAGLLLLAGPQAAWSLYSVHAFGHALPNTNAAKRAGPDDSVLGRLVKIYGSGLPVILVGAAAGVLHLVLHPGAALGSARSAFTGAMPARADGEHSSMAATLQCRLPLWGWVFVLWSGIATIFYIANHTYVQTRYILLTAPGLTVVIFAVALCRWRGWGRWLYAMAFAAAAGVSLVVVVPFLHNKSEVCGTARQIAQFLHNDLPPDAPVAVYSIGQIAFESEHPIVDTGGITQPGVIPYLDGPQELRTHWAESVGAQYYIASDPPELGAVAVFTLQAPSVGWTLHTSQYRSSTPVSVWRLPSAQPAQR